uniref:Nucleoporin_N domain-containing protein n=1 Tax=Steinernema glaseri TaxID=37863 RepID=A0A1I7YN66_9BILA
MNDLLPASRIKPKNAIHVRRDCMIENLSSAQASGVEADCQRLDGGIERSRRLVLGGSDAIVLLSSFVTCTGENSWGIWFYYLHELQVAFLPLMWGKSEQSVQNAAVVVDDCINKDRIYIDSAAKLTRDMRCNRMTKVAVSGLASGDYKDFPSLMDVKEFSKIETRPIPKDLRDQMKRMRSHCGMGMFPEISRAWMTIDSDLFIWSYNIGEDLAFFDGVPNAVITTTLANTKPGVFSENVHFLLAVATTVEIVLYAVCFYYTNGNSVPLNDKDYSNYEMYLIPDPVYSIGLDGAVVSGMKATKDGRIFFTADDSLFELCYEAQTWFKNKCRKVNHSKSYGSIISNLFTKKDNIIQIVIDDERHILYTLSERKTVHVFDLGVDGNDCRKLNELSADALAHIVVCNTNLDGDSIKDVVALSVVPVKESHFLNFVLVNSSGVRMYFTCLSPDADLSYFNSIGSDDFIRIVPLSLEQTRPKTIRLVHVRLPRDFNTFRAHGDNVYLMCHTSDTTVLLKSGSNSRCATAVFMSSANYSLSTDMSENVECQVVQGLTWSIEKFEEDSNIKYLTSPGMLPDMNPPLTVYQHVTEPDRFFFMTSEGVAFVDRHRPTDILRHILTNFGAESKQRAAFSSIHGPKNTMTMVLDILSSNLNADLRVKEEAQRVFFMVGGEAQTFAGGLSDINPVTGSASPQHSMAEYTPRASNFASTPFSRGAPAPLNVSGVSTIFPSTTAQTSRRYFLERRDPLSHATNTSEYDTSLQKSVLFSHRHDALYSYFARLLGKFWTQQVCFKKGNTLACRYSSEELAWLARKLRQFKEAINEYKLIPAAESGFVNSSAAYGKVEAKLKERKSMMDLYNLIVLSCETLHLLKLVTDRQFHAVTSHMADHIRNELLNITFSDLVSSGTMVPAELISCLVRHYLGDNATTNVISESLRKHCSSLFSMEDATAAEALEMLQRAPQIPEGADRRKLCEEALGLFRKSIVKVNVHSVADLFRQVHMFDSLVELALYKAASDDPQNIAVIAYRQGIVSGDRDLADARGKRKDAYSCIIETLNLLLDPMSVAELRLTELSASTYRTQILNTVMRSDDELANVEIFDWLIDHNMSNFLVESGSVYVESYLRHKVESRDDVRYQDVLWRHCERNGKFIAAAKLLHGLTDGTRVDVNLRQRITYLSQALLCCRSEQTNENMHVFVQELEDKLEVAMVQERLKESISSITPNDQFSKKELEDAIANLDQKIYSLNELYSEFAETFDLPLEKLSILKCACYFEEQTIHEVWMEIMEREFSNRARVGGEFSEIFLAKLINLSRDYKNSPMFFPTELILRMVITRSFEHGIDPNWLFRFHKVPEIGLAKVLEVIYGQYAGDSDPFWKSNSRAEFYLGNAVIKIGNEFVDNVKKFSAVQRRAVIDQLKTLLASFTISMNREHVSEFKLRCKSLENKLNRLSNIV